MTAMNTAAAEHPAYVYGQRAARDGRYRVLACPADADEERAWLAGYNSVAQETISGETARLPTRYSRALLLTEALGVELTPREQLLIGWLSGMIERRDAETLAELFCRSRRALAEPVAPEPAEPTDPWAEFDDIAWELVE